MSDNQTVTLYQLYVHHDYGSYTRVFPTFESIFEYIQQEYDEFGNPMKLTPWFPGLALIRPDGVASVEDVDRLEYDKYCRENHAPDVWRYYDASTPSVSDEELRVWVSHPRAHSYRMNEATGRRRWGIGDYDIIVQPVTFPLSMLEVSQGGDMKNPFITRGDD